MSTRRTKYVIINDQGIAFGKNGLSNPPEVAIDIDGNVVAESGFFRSITTNLIQSELGSSLDLSSNTSINLIIKDVQVGGTNLLPNSGFEAGTGGWTKNTGSEVFQDGSVNTIYNGKNLLLTCPGGVASSGIYRIYDQFKIGEEYTFSAMVYAESDFWFGTGNENAVTAGGGWKKIEQTFTATQTSHGLYFIFQDSASAKALYIDNVKLEWGNKATDWSPSP